MITCEWRSGEKHFARIDVGDQQHTVLGLMRLGVIVIECHSYQSLYTIHFKSLR